MDGKSSVNRKHSSKKTSPCRPRRPEWLRDELRRLETEQQHLERAIASLETFQARHGEETDPEVILGLDEAREQLKEIAQRRQVLVQGWREICDAVYQVQARCP